MVLRIGGRGSYVVCVRDGPRTERRRFNDLDAALLELEALARALAENRSGKTVDLKLRQFEPLEQVVARLELTGPARLRAGVDVRGDGSQEAFTGRVRRRVIEQQSSESPYQALRRVLIKR